MQSSNKTIAKNTIILYGRMFITMFVGLFTSRVVLKTLGIEDFGLYSVVSSVVTMCVFMNGALASSTSRFLTFEIGGGNFDKLHKTFCTTLSLHLIFSFVLLIILETIGLWLLSCKLNISESRQISVFWAYQAVVFTTVLSISQVPYTALVISHEKMKVFAYMSIYDVSAKLGVAYLLYFSSFDKLRTYATLLLVVQVSSMVFYRLYCVRNFKEARYVIMLEKSILKPILSFSGWSLVAAGSIMLLNQGLVLLFQRFFGPSVVAAQAIAFSVQGQVMAFAANFRMAVIPQIVKRHASGEKNNSKELLKQSTVFSFFLISLFGLPVLMNCTAILKIWLGQVPEYSDRFLQLVMLGTFFSIFDISFYTVLYTVGRLRENAMANLIGTGIVFPLILLYLYSGCSPIAVFFVLLCKEIVIGVIVKPFLVMRIDNNYTIYDLRDIFMPCIKVFGVGLFFAMLIQKVSPESTIAGCLKILLTLLSTLGVIYFIGLPVGIRSRFLQYIYTNLKMIFERKNS